VRVAVVGGGIAGIAAAAELADHGGDVSVTLFEAAPVLGGHAHTVTAEVDGTTVHLDTGFMVFNNRTYPTFTGLLARWGVASQPSNMSFGFACADSGLQYAGTSLSGIFAQRRRVADPRFWRMLVDVVRFGQAGRRLLARPGDTTTIGELLAARRWSDAFVHEYLIPLGSAIWSCDPGEFADFPARGLCQFLDNHGLLTLLDRPLWYTIVGGSSRYVEAAARRLGDAVRVGTPVTAVRRDDAGVLLRTAAGEERFDEVVLALHADDALAVLEDASPAETDILAAFPYTPNDVVLHTDRALLPPEQRAWASWNYHRPLRPSGQVQVTYHLNRLQAIDSPHQFCVTLNRTEDIEPGLVLWRSTSRHPRYSAASFAAQDRWAEISGVRHTHYCGAYWGWGFHEDGAASGARAARAVIDAAGRR